MDALPRMTMKLPVACERHSMCQQFRGRWERLCRACDCLDRDLPMFSSNKFVKSCMSEQAMTLWEDTTTKTLGIAVNHAPTSSVDFNVSIDVSSFDIDRQTSHCWSYESARPVLNNNAHSSCNQHQARRMGCTRRVAHAGHRMVVHMQLSPLTAIC